MIYSAQGRWGIMLFYIVISANKIKVKVEYIQKYGLKKRISDLDTTYFLEDRQTNEFSSQENISHQTYNYT